MLYMSNVAKLVELYVENEKWEDEYGFLESRGFWVEVNPLF